MAQLVKSHAPIMVLGSQESGKTTAIRSYLKKVSEKSFSVSVNSEDQGLSQLASIISLCL